ncbi:MAG: hypothetical protein IPG71_10465 [bacterium]|nr:hypothetical protein [bacterium]
MRLLSMLLGVVLIVSGVFAVTITQAEYFVDTDPGQGLGTAITITSGETVSIAGLPVSTVGLPAGVVHRLFLRYKSDENVWSLTEGRYFYPISAQSGSVTQDDVVQAEYWFDALPSTFVDLTDSPNITYPALIPATGLSLNAPHRFFLRFQDEDGNWTMAEGRYFYIIEGASGTIEIKNVTALEYWLDSNPPTLVDIADAPTGNFAQLIPAGTETGIHTFNTRYRDEDSVWSMAETRRFVLISEFASNYQPKTLVAAEYFINGNPAPGGAIPLPTTTDGAYDEGQEENTVVVTNLPIGQHLFCIRYQDSEGIWTAAYCDSVLMTPILVIHRSGSDIVLSWQADPLHVPFHVYRSANTAGPFTEIGTSNTLGFSDAGRVDSAATQGFYYITTTPGALSSFRLPAQANEQQTRQ